MLQGRLRLGVSIGWNRVEYDALGVDYRKRTSILEDQLSLLRRLWTEQSFSDEGVDYKIVEAGSVRCLFSGLFRSGREEWPRRR